MKKRVAVVQSNYIPWKGYFDLIATVDEFILFDDVQYTRRDWRNRNRIKTPHGTKWLTIPVAAKGRYSDAIKDIEISDASWGAEHWRTLERCYRQAPYFALFRDRFEEMYCGARDARLSAVNRRFLETVCDILGLETKITWSMDYTMCEGKTERLVSLCRQAGATTYISGPSARGYIDPELFREAGIELVFFDYTGYREYEQLYPPFDHHVSVLDLLFSAGPHAREHLLTP
jgi:hypothetical protein